MKNQSTQTVSKGLGLGTLLFLIFLVLKLAEIGQVKDWSWWYVTAPLWAPLLLWLFVLATIACIYGLIGFIGFIFGKK